MSINGTIPYKNYDEQIVEIGKKGIFCDPEKIELYKDYLREFGYYTIINGFKRNFLLPGHADLVEKDTRFEFFIACHRLEMDLYSILLKYSQIVEQHFRTALSHVIAKYFGTNQVEYLNRRNYTDKDNTRYKILLYLQNLSNEPNQNSYSYHFKKTKKNIPPWILLLDSNFYNCISLYSILKKNQRDEIRSEFILVDRNNKLQNRYFIRSLHFLREYRNIFAHSKRHFAEKINYSVNKEYFNSFLEQKYMDAMEWDEDERSKDLFACILLVYNYLNIPLFKKRMQTEINMLFQMDGYINSDGSPIALFNGRTIFEITNLPILIMDLA